MFLGRLYCFTSLELYVVSFVGNTDCKHQTLEIQQSRLYGFSQPHSDLPKKRCSYPSDMRIDLIHVQTFQDCSYPGSYLQLLHDGQALLPAPIESHNKRCSAYHSLMNTEEFNGSVPCSLGETSRYKY